MAEAAQLITSIATLLGVLLSIFLGLRGLEKINKVEQQTNGVLALVSKKSAEAGHAAGVVDERARAAGEAADE
jgi:peroxiredoxin family protein